MSSKKKEVRPEVVHPCGGTCVFDPCTEPCCFEDDHDGRCKCNKHRFKPVSRISPMLMFLPLFGYVLWRFFS
jgi:hypothetical protein